MESKAADNDFTARFREIVSDPLNLVIKRDSRAGLVDHGFVFLHNGLKVPISGPDAYYGEFSAILVINRGVHEPLEEFVFQEVLKRLPNSPVMLELGAYWGHYSMWLKSVHANAIVHLVESSAENLNSGIRNFETNGLTGIFVHASVGRDQFLVDRYLHESGIDRLDVLHSDIQGFEAEMLEGCTKALTERCIDYVFISTHSADLHSKVISRLSDFRYRIEVSSDFECETTSYDGFIFASNPGKPPVFGKFTPLGRTKIESQQPESLVAYIVGVLKEITR